MSTCIYDVPVAMLVDTGANVTVLKREIFEKLPPSSKEKLKPVDLNLVTATGETSSFVGKITVEIKIGKHTFCHDVLVADIQNDGILGVDFLSPNKCDVLLSKSCLSVKGDKIPCFHFNKSMEPTICRIAVAQDVVIPPESEIIVSGKFVDPVVNIKTGIVEVVPSFVQNTGLMLAYGLVKPEVGVIPLRLLNMTGKECKISQNTVSANLQTVELVEECFSDNRIKSVNNVKVSDEIPPHLQELYDKSSKKLNDEEKQQFKTLLIKYQNAFSKDPKDIGTTDLIEHNINTGNANPIRQHPRRIPLAKMKEAEDEIKDMASRGIIEPSYGPWSSPVVLVKKKDGTTRFCVDYRRLNDVTIKDSHPLPRIDDTLDALSGSTLFSVVDLRSGYWNVKISDKDKPKTAFSIPGSGLWQFTKMSFGLCNAPATFVRLMERVLRGLSWKICLVYLDDIIVFSKTFTQHLENLSQVFECLRKADLKMSPQKCSLFKDQVIFLGHVVSANGIATDPSKLESVTNWPIPKNVKQVRSFLGLCSYYRKFVKNFADIARPLHKLTEADRKFDWTESCQESFETLKKALTSAPILSYPTSDDMFILDTDASNEGMGSVLSQVQNGVERVICYFSKAFSKQERRYCVTRRELLAVVASIKNFHHYLYGRQFIVRSDHGALRWLFKFKNPEGQIARWLETLSTYNFKIEHRAGRIHSNADALSRRPCCESGCNYCLRAESRYENVSENAKEESFSESSDLYIKSNVSENVVKEENSSSDSMNLNVTNKYSNQSVCVVTRSQTTSGQMEVPCSSGRSTESESSLHFESDKSLFNEQRRDPIIGQLIEWKTENARPEWQKISAGCTELKYYWSRFDSFDLRDGILCYKWENETGNKTVWQILLPSSLRKTVFTQLHGVPTAGHLGIKKTLMKVKARYFWFGLRRDVEYWISKCDVCASRKHPTKRPKAPLKLYSVGVPMERLAIDVTGPFPRTQRGNKYILVISDYFTKWTQAFAIRDQEAPTVANVLVNNVVSLFGVPRFLHSDKGSNFESHVFTEMCKILGIDKTRTTTKRPQSDGMVERNIKTIKEMLSAFVDNTQKNWDLYLPLLMMAYRSSVHESTGVSPCSMMLGREITLPIDLVLGVPEEENKTYSTQYAYELAECLKFIHEFARNKLKITGLTMKKYYDHKIDHKIYDVGAPVWLHNPKSKHGLSRKLQREWCGPFVVIQRLNDVIYRVQETPKSKPKIVHHDKLKKYTGENAPTWFAEVK